MTEPIHDLAIRMLRLARVIMPDHRGEWASAMRAELDHLAPQDRLGFAFECVRSAVRERLTDAATMLAAARLAIVFGLCAAAAICLRTSFMLWGEAPSMMILAIGIIALAAAIAVRRAELRRLPAVAIAGFASAMLAILMLGDVAALVGGGAPSSRFYRAILLEQVAAWAVMLGLVHGLLALDTRRSAHG